MLSVSKAGGYYVLQLEDTLAPALVYVTRPEVEYRIPHGDDRIVFSPKSFSGRRHLIRARIARPEEVAARRNLAFNPYDRHGDTGIYPHARANVETRGEAVFAAYNAIDGIYENGSHGEWPYQSWGINGTRTRNGRFPSAAGGHRRTAADTAGGLPARQLVGKRCRRVFGRQRRNVGVEKGESSTGV